MTRPAPLTELCTVLEAVSPASYPLEAVPPPHILTSPWPPTATPSIRQPLIR